MTSHCYLHYMHIYACEYIRTHTSTMINTLLVWTSYCYLYYIHIFVCEYIRTYTNTMINTLLYGQIK